MTSLNPDHRSSGDITPKAGRISYQELVENLSEVLYTTDTRAVVTYVSPNVYNIGGYTQEEIIGRPFTDFVFPEDLEGRKEAFQRIMNGSTEATEYRYLTKDQRLIWVRTSARPIIKQGRKRGLQGVLVDITERRESEEALRRSEETYRTIFENSGIPMIMVDEDMSILVANSEVQEVFGYSPKQILGRPWTEFIPEDALQELLDFRIQRRTNSEGSSRKIASRVRDRQGGLKDVVITAAVIPGSGQAVISLQDMTEQYALQERLQQAQKMEALGTLAGGVAHDFNNILQGIFGGIELMKVKSGIPASIAGTVQAMEKTVARGKQIVDRLLTFSHKSKPSFHVLDMREVVASTVELLRRTLPRKLVLETHCQSDAPRIYADPAQMEQLLLNLVNNARDAIQSDEEQGRVTISLAKQVSEGRPSSAGNPPPGEYLLLHVSDNGAGIEASDLDKIFEPFYSTKGPGKGTGLGLSSAYGIAQAHSGQISCSSTPGQGTTFSVLLPACKQEAQEIPISPHEEKGPPHAERGRGETVLIADDEQFIRESTAAFLHQRGYLVHLAATGEEALSIFAEQGRIDAAVMDLDMPGMGGLQAIRNIRTIHPGLPILVITGHSFSSMTDQTLALEKCEVLAKPFSFEELHQRLRNRLDGSQPGPGLGEA